MWFYPYYSAVKKIENIKKHILLFCIIYALFLSVFQALFSILSIKIKGCV